MRKVLVLSAALAGAALLALPDAASARPFGGFRGGHFGGFRGAHLGGFRGAHFGGFRAAHFGGFRAAHLGAFRPGFVVRPAFWGHRRHWGWGPAVGVGALAAGLTYAAAAPYGYYYDDVGYAGDCWREATFVWTGWAYERAWVTRCY